MDSSNKKKRQRGKSWSAHVSPSGKSFVGELNGMSVLVRDENHVKDLWRHGCYGKGVMSRSVAGSKVERKERKNAFHGRSLEKQVDDVRAASLLGCAGEPCQLTPEEALYLCSEEKCLTVGSFDAESLWRHFCGLWGGFRRLYCAYWHYRRLGWIVRAGSKMGVDFVLYREHPGAVHAEHSVVVTGSRESWAELLGIGRVSENVRKTLVLCRVTMSEEGEEQESSLDKTLAGSSVSEWIYKRWATNRTRDAAEDEDDKAWSDD